MFRGLVMGKKPWPLYLFGKPGLGKSRAVLWLSDHVRTALYCQFPEMVERYAASRRPYKPEPWNIENYFGAKYNGLLIIDEIGMTPNSQATNDEYRLLKNILDLRDCTPLILVSNLDHDGLQDVYDDRIASRCCAGTVIEIRGQDRRIQKVKK